MELGTRDSERGTGGEIISQVIEDFKISLIEDGKSPKTIEILEHS